MAVKEAAKEIGKGMAWGVPTYVASFMDKLAGLTLPDLVSITAIIYTSILILRQVPKCIGCVRCFIRNRTCANTCKG